MTTEQTLQDQLRADAESGEHARSTTANMFQAIQRIDKLERQLAEALKDQADAARYRWLRDDASGYQRAGPLVYWSGEHGESIRITYGQSLDDELDYAMGAAIAPQKVKP